MGIKYWRVRLVHGSQHANPEPFFPMSLTSDEVGGVEVVPMSVLYALYHLDMSYAQRGERDLRRAIGHDCQNLIHVINIVPVVRRKWVEETDQETLRDNYISSVVG
jgi:hypothetical protein